MIRPQKGTLYFLGIVCFMQNDNGVPIDVSFGESERGRCSFIAVHVIHIDIVYVKFYLPFS